MVRCAAAWCVFALPEPLMGKTTAAPAEFEEEFVAGLKSIFEEKIVFNRMLGLKIVRFGAHRHEA